MVTAWRGWRMRFVSSKRLDKEGFGRLLERLDGLGIYASSAFAVQSVSCNA